MELFKLVFTSSTWGDIQIISTTDEIVAIGMEQQPIEDSLWKQAYDVTTIEEKELLEKRCNWEEYDPEKRRQARKILNQAQEWITTLERGKNPGPPLSVRLEGTDFQKKVWQAILEIPYGVTVTYKDIAMLVYGNQHPKLAYRAIGNCVGKNPIPIMIPCHRVVGSNGMIGGYAGGLLTKVSILLKEHIDVQSFKGIPDDLWNSINSK